MKNFGKLAILILCRSIPFLVLAPSLVHAHRDSAVGIHQVDWHTSQIARAFSAFTSEEGKTKSIEGRRCLLGSAFYFDVLDDYAFDIDETVVLEVEFYLNSVASKIQLSYDANAPKNTSGEHLAPHGLVQEFRLPSLSNDKRWHKERFILERARFAGLGRFVKNDFHLGVVGSGSV